VVVERALDDVAAFVGQWVEARGSSSCAAAAFLRCTIRSEGCGITARIPRARSIALIPRDE